MKDIVERLIANFQEWTLPDLMPRQLAFPEIHHKVTVVTGMRRTGKTSLCLERLKDLQRKGVDKSRLLYLSFEDDRLLDFRASNFQDILDVFYGMFPRNKDRLCYWVLDEIQRIDHWEAFVRRMIDTENIRLVLTGSSARLLSREIATALRGRSFDIEVLPFSFGEYLAYHKLCGSEALTFGDRTVARLRRAINDYLLVGGFPEIQDVDAMTRVRILQGYVDAVLFRDIVERFKTTNVIALRQMIRAIVSNPGLKFSVAKFHRTLQGLGVKCSRNDLYEDLAHLEEAFLVYAVKLHTESVRIQQVNPAKYYPVDTGLANALSVAPDSDRGALLETLVFFALRRRGYLVEYVITPERYEVDFLATSTGRSELLVQACYDCSRPETREREVRALLAAQKQNSRAKCLIVTWDEAGELDGGIRLVPIWRFLLDE